MKRCWLVLTSALFLLSASVFAQPAVFERVTLRDHRGQAIDAASLRGRPLLLNFVFTGCSSTCPVQVQELAALHRKLPPDVRDAVAFLSVSVDPAHDTPQSLADFARRMDADLPGWRFATGAAVQVDALISRMQIQDPRRSDPRPQDHRTSLYLFDAKGALVQRFAGVPVDRPRLTAELSRLAHQQHGGA